MNKRKIFLAISYTKRKKVENAIANFLKTKGFEVITGRICKSGQSLDKEIKRLIKDCDFGVVVYNELRHNISYEWGLLDALCDKDKIFLLKDENVHIDLDYELSDRKGTIFTHFYGEDSEEEIIRSLEQNEGLMSAIGDCIGKSISSEPTENVKKAAEILAKSNLPLTGIGEKNIKIDDIDEIIEALSNIKKLTAKGHFYKAYTYYYTKKYDKAEEMYRKAIEANPNLADAHYNLGILLKNLERYDEAEKEYREAIRINPEYVSAYNNLGFLLHEELKRYDEAEECYRKAVGIDPEDALPHNNLGYLLKRLKRYEEAKKEFMKAIEINKDALANQNLSELYFIQKDYENSLEIARNALDASKSPYEKIISNFLILINLIVLGKSYDIDQFIRLLKENKRYEQSYIYHFDEIKNAAYGLECEEKILDLTNKMEEFKG